MYSAERQGVVEVAPLLIIAALTLVALSLWMWHSAREEVQRFTPPSLLLLHGVAPKTPQTSPNLAPKALAQRIDPKLGAQQSPTLQVPALPKGVVGAHWQQNSGRAMLIRPDRSTLSLSVDAKVQATLERYLKRKQVDYGAVVLMDPKTGAVRAYVEHREAGSAVGQGHGLTKAIAPAASIFKVVSGAALLEAGAHPDEKTCFHGGRRGISAALLKPSSRDTICETLAMSLARSSNVAFARQTLKRLSPDALTDVASRLGFGEALPFDIGIDSSAVAIPNTKLGLGRASAGFVGSRLSPLHAATLAATIANDGLMMRPWLVESDSLQPGHVRRPEAIRQAISPETAQSLRAMMELTVSQGTARKQFRGWPRALSGVHVGGKTGSLSETKDGVWRHYTWFVGFAPADNPQIAVAAVAVNGKKWRTRGPTIARLALQAWLSRRPTTSASGPGVERSLSAASAKAPKATKVLDTSPERG